MLEFSWIEYLIRGAELHARNWNRVVLFNFSCFFIFLFPFWKLVVELDHVNCSLCPS